MRPLALGLRAPYRLKRSIALLAQASLNIDFTRGGPIDSRVTFTRASGGTSFRPVSYGPERVPDPSFDDTSKWLKGTGWSVTGGNGVATAAALNANLFPLPSLYTTVGNIYLATVVVTAVTGTLRLNVWDDVSVIVTSRDITAPGTYTLPFVATTTRCSAYMSSGTAGLHATVASLTMTEVILDRPGDPVRLFLAPAMVPRREYDSVTGVCKGILVEEQRQNLLADSTLLHLWAASAGATTKSTDIAIAPDGTMTADSFVATAIPGHHEVYKSLNAGAAGTLVSYSIFVKSLGSYTKARLADTGNGTFAVSFDLVSGAVSNTSGARFISAGMEKLLDGWWRCHVVHTSDGTATARSVCGYPDNAALDLYGATFTGDGVSGVYVWGAQVEAGAFPSSYIPTMGASATRAADGVVVNTLTPWYNQSEGTLFADVASSKGTALQYATAASFVGSALGVNYIVAGFNATNASTLITGGSTMVSSAASAGQAVKIALGLSSGFQSMVINGGSSVNRAASAPLDQMTALRIGYWEGNPGHLNGCIRRVAYWPRRMSTLDLQGLTR